jgi:hypothetical protein
MFIKVSGSLKIPEKPKINLKNIYAQYTPNLVNFPLIWIKYRE